MYIFVQMGFKYPLQLQHIFSLHSSTNAYMLIYRLKDPSRNASKSLLIISASKRPFAADFSHVVGLKFFYFFILYVKCFCVLSAEVLDVEDFPEHIKSLVQKEKESEEQEKRQREIERNTCKVHVFGLV